MKIKIFKQMRTFFLTFSFILFVNFINAQEVPSIYKNIYYDDNGELYYDANGKKLRTIEKTLGISYENIIGNPSGSANGLIFDFKTESLNGTVFYGFIPYEETKYPQPVFFKKTADIIYGKADVNLMKMRGKYDMIDWEKKGKGMLGYRVVRDNGDMLYDGRIGFRYAAEKGFSIDTTIIEGPFLNCLTHNGIIISYTTNFPVKTSITVGSTVYSEDSAVRYHEIKINKLFPSTNYFYTVNYGDNSERYTFKTAPVPGNKKEFTFAYASDSRAGMGGGERSFYGPNYYIMRKILALVSNEGAAFCQFTGDLINGYSTSVTDLDIQYANWKRSIEIFAHHIPVYTTMGNHEALMYIFNDPDTEEDWDYEVDRFPFETQSAEYAYAKNFVNPMNGPESEDGTEYDPNPDKIDFPSYKESVYYYTYGNMAMVVLNSNYLYAPTMANKPGAGGNLHAYIMDKQYQWLVETIKKLEENKTIDHIFVTIHTPAFPNGGHVDDDMWYNGDNKFRGNIAGKKFKKGIIERRDDILDLLINQSDKTVALLTGDEHNYCRLEVTNETNIYPENWDKDKITISRPFYQINNGAAGAPYYAMEQTPWSSSVKKFSTQNAVVFVRIKNKKVYVKVINPDTYELLEEVQIK